jgi:4-aminobutyrate aminotransferase-like enzyme
MALAQIDEIRRLRLPARAAALGSWLGPELARIAARVPAPFQARSRVRGLMAGLELRHRDRPGRPAGTEALTVVQRLLQRGYILLPEGAEGEVISLTPPLVIPAAELRTALATLETELAGLAPGGAPRGPGRGPGAPGAGARANREWR